jgi:predicted outer membrane repeat protein
MPRLSSLVFVTLALASGASARVWHVNPDGTGDVTTIRAGVDTAAVGDTVLVACGRYLEHDIEMPSGVTLRSEHADPDCAVIDAGGRGRLFHCVDLDSTTVIEGFTLTGGLAKGEGASCHGGAMYCERSAHRVTRCAFVENRAACSGGGVYCRESSPVLEACTFRGNRDAHGTHGLHGDRSSSPRVRKCDFGEKSDTGSHDKHGRRSRKHHGGHH